MMIEQMGKMLIFFGIILVVVGGVIILIGKTPLGKLPGDILIKRDNFTFFFPITTSIVISVVLTVILWVIMVLRR